MHHIVRKLILTLLLALPLPVAAQAQSLDDKVKYILEVGNFSEGVDTGFNAFRPMLLQQLKQTSSKITPEAANQIATIAGEELNALKPALLGFGVEFIKKKLDEEEINAMYEFYKTPVGARLGRKMSAAMPSLMTELQPFMAVQFAPRFQARLSQDPKLRSLLTP